MSPPTGLQLRQSVERIRGEIDRLQREGRHEEASRRIQELIGAWDKLRRGLKGTGRAGPRNRTWNRRSRPRCPSKLEARVEKLEGSQDQVTDQLREIRKLLETKNG